jgi:hypothetical protein
LQLPSLHWLTQLLWTQQQLLLLLPPSLRPPSTLLLLLQSPLLLLTQLLLQLRPYLPLPNLQRPSQPKPQLCCLEPLRRLLLLLLLWSQWSKLVSLAMLLLHQPHAGPVSGHPGTVGTQSRQQAGTEDLG